MKVAITSQGMNAESLVDSRFGRCQCFAIYDTQSGSLNFIKNPNRSVDSGAGPASVALVANQGVKKIVSGEFGMKIKDLLHNLDIQMVIMKQPITVAQVVDLLTKNAASN